jgi:pilus assembly protein CpaE
MSGISDLSAHDPFDLGDLEDGFAPEPEDTLEPALRPQGLSQPAAAPERLETPAEAAPDPFAGFDEPEPVQEEMEVEPAPSPGSGIEAAALAFASFDTLERGELIAPRIAIHFFSRKPETISAIQTAIEDRRLQRTTPKILPGGLAEAAAIYHEQPTPPLIIVEAVEEPAELLRRLDALAEVCDPSTKVVVIGKHNDIALYRELMRRGVSEYLAPPIDPVMLIRAITDLYSDPTAAFVGRAISFVGVKGGAGSSTLAHNVAHALANQIQLNTVVVDYDLPFGTAGLDFNQDPLQGLHDALTQPDRLDSVLLDRLTARCSDHLSLFTAPASLEDTYEIGPEAYEEVFNRIRTTAPYLILDLPHVWTGWIRQTLLASDEIVMVATPELASLRNAKNMLDLIRRARPNDAPPRLILNQTGVQNRPEIPVKEFAKALQLEPSLVLPFEPKLFGDAANNGQMVFEVNAKSKVCDGLLQFAQSIARRETAPTTPAKGPSFIDRLLKRG